MGTNIQINRVIVVIRQYFSLKDDKESETDIVGSIRKGAEFKGTNLWVLVFAIFLASIGLNVNSTAVIIGAMLISPLMSPIMGIGLGLGIYDFGLIKKAGRNFLIAIIISIITSSVYFLITPLTEAQSELLSRTTPTIWDVLIALFGGLAGIIASSSKAKGNVIPGVAIATALMPPLCTAGYGIANGNFLFFAGAIYLFFINSVFICLATFLIVRILKIQKNEFVNLKIETKIKRYIYIIIAITVIPSVFMAYRIVSRSIFEQNARKFILNELSFSQSQIVSKNIIMKSGDNTIDITYIGKHVDSILIENARAKLPKYQLIGTKLIVRQGEYSNVNEINYIKSGIIEELYKKNDILIKSQDEKIAFLENELLKFEKSKLPIIDLTNEVLTEHPNIYEFSINNSVLYNAGKNKFDTLFIAYIGFKKWPSKTEVRRLNNWLKVRVKSEKVKLIIK
jgi:uncharacterized hydrophobic protein (TIGR00271 family)